MTDLRKAAEMALEDICGAKLCEINSMSSRAEMLRLMDKAAQALRQALAQPEQEPVAWGMPKDDGSILDVICPEEHAREPGNYTVPLYTAPPKREWVGMTDDEIYDFVCNTESYLALSKALEAKLKDKNCG